MVPGERCEERAAPPGTNLVYMVNNSAIELERFPSKSRAAFMMNAHRVFDIAETRGHRVYFWTFTFSGLHADWESSALFSRFLGELRRTVGPGWGGVKVSELHREHGVHYHALVTERLAVDLVRKVGRCFGIGRVHVCRADRRRHCNYLAKYLSKQREGALTKTGRRGRRWSVFGDIPRTRVRDLVNDSPMWVFRRKENLPWLDSFAAEKLLARAWEHGEVAFRSAWFLAKRGELGDVCGLVVGRLEARGGGELVERADFRMGPF